MDIKLFDYKLPKEKIAQSPVRPRERAKLLFYDKFRGLCRDHHVSDLPQLLLPGDLLVFNVTKVRAARIPESIITSSDSNISEILILKPLQAEGQFECLMKGRHIQVGEEISLAPHPNPTKLGDSHRGEASTSHPSPLGEAVRGSKEPSDSRRGGRRPGEGVILTILDKIEEGMGRFVVKVHGMTSTQFLIYLEEIGKLPLPPYIHNPQIDGYEQELYQPIFARELGSVASPTASLHFSDKLLEEVQQKGVHAAELVLHVGLGTFMPVRVEDTDDHIMHAEWAEVSEDLIKKIEYTKKNGGRIIAVGTTVLRALESAYLASHCEETTRWMTKQSAVPFRSSIEPRRGAPAPSNKNNHSGQIAASSTSYAPHNDRFLNPYKGETDLFIQPGFKFNIVDGLLTNFHMPKSTLLMLVAAFVGREKLFELYNHALESDYRFLSFGDCMLLI